MDEDLEGEPPPNALRALVSISRALETPLLLLDLFSSTPLPVALDIEVRVSVGLELILVLVGELP